MLPVELTMTGKEVCQLMRRHKITIRELARRTQFSQIKVRQVRTRGLRGTLAVLDWQEAIIGEFTPRMRAQFRQYQAAKQNLLARAFA